MGIPTNEELIDLLNQAVARELQVSIQYVVQHTKMEKILQRIRLENILLDETTYDVVGSFLKEFSIEEMKHAGEIMERIYLLGGEATTKASKPKIGEYLSDFARYGLEAEEEALSLYRKIIDLSGKLGDWETRELFEKIYSDEEKHFFKFQEYVDIEPDLDSPKAPEAEWMKTITDDYLTLLNKALAGEIQAIIQYTNQHEKASKLIYRKKSKTLEVVKESNKAKVISEMLKKIFIQEMEHFEKIAERIFFLDGEATVVPDPLPNVGETPDDWLLNDRQAEDEAIVLYRKIIEEATKRGDYPTRALFEKIITEEDEHFFMFDDFFAYK
ncbi:MAG: ferritin-like domain-containing protein [Candidatus Hodarchaeales archaeon]|jgi:bacterioferritin